MSRDMSCVATKVAHPWMCVLCSAQIFVYGPKAGIITCGYANLGWGTSLEIRARPCGTVMDYEYLFTGISTIQIDDPPRLGDKQEK